MARKRRVSWLSVFYFLVILGALVGGSVWLDRKGEQVVAKVTSKTEEITVTHDPQGGWYRYFRVGAEFDAAGALMSATVTVDRARYDALHLGDSLEIRYLPILPLFARTPDRSTATVAAEAAHHLLGSRLLWWIGGGAIAMVIAARIGIVPIVVAGLFWMVAGYALLLQAPRVPEPSGVETGARVRSVTLVTKSPARRTPKSPPLTRVPVGIHNQTGDAIPSRAAPGPRARAAGLATRGGRRGLGKRDRPGGGRDASGALPQGRCPGGAPHRGD